METGEIIALIIVGALAGRAAASFLGGRGDLIRDTVIGILGALVGGFLFNALDINLPDTLEAPITVGDILVAFCGAVLVIFLLRRIR